MIRLALPDRLERIARSVSQADAEAAEAIRELAEDRRKPERERYRKALLRQAARMSFGLSRAAQAELLEAPWATVSDDDEYAVGSIEELLQRLKRAGFRPLSKRRIIDLLDPGMD